MKSTEELMELIECGALDDIPEMKRKVQEEIKRRIIAEMFEEGSDE